MSNHNAYATETIDVVEIQITVSGVIVDMDELEYAAVLEGADRSGAIWAPAVEDNGRVGYWLDGTLAAGTYHIWGRRTPPVGNTIPWIDCGTIELY